VEKSHLLKQYESQMAKLKAEISALENNIAQMRKELSLKYRLKSELLAKIQNLQQPNEIVVSEHAVLRYLERVQGIGLDEIRKKILTSSVVDLIDKLEAGNGQYPVKEGGFSIRLKDNVIVTII
jgi:hypothetical protein